MLCSLWEKEWKCSGKMASCFNFHYFIIVMIDPSISYSLSCDGLQEFFVFGDQGTSKD